MGAGQIRFAVSTRRKHMPHNLFNSSCCFAVVFAVLLLQGLWRPQGRARPPQQAGPLSSSSPAHPVKQSQCSTKQVQKESSGAGEPANNTIAPHKPSRHLKNCVSSECMMQEQSSSSCCAPTAARTVHHRSELCCLWIVLTRLRCHTLLCVRSVRRHTLLCVKQCETSFVAVCKAV